MTKGPLSELDVEELLSKLCVQLGFCLHPPESDSLRVAPPGDVRTFIDAVFLAEGLDPNDANRGLYRQVRDVVAQAFLDAADRQESSQITSARTEISDPGLAQWARRRSKRRYRGR